MRISRELISVGAVPSAAMLSNLASYAMLLTAAHVLPKGTYGETSSVLSLLLVATIPMLGLQTAVARRVATGGDPAGFVRGVVVVSAGATVLFVALSPLLSALIHAGSLVATLAVAACAGPMAVLGAGMGVAQGRRAFGRLATLTLAATGVRALTGVAGLMLGRSAAATMLGELVGVLLTLVWAVATTPGARELWARSTHHGSRELALETLHAAHAYGVFLLLTSADLLLARNMLDPSAAGVYAVGSVITRAALWLPQSVTLIVFASLADPAAHRRSTRQGVMLVAALGAACVVGAAQFGPLAVTVVGGSRYHAIDGYVWQFALLGVMLSLLQVSLIAGLAQRHNRRIALLWVALAAYLGALLPFSSHMTVHRLVTTVDVVAAIACLVGIVIAVRHHVDAGGDSAGRDGRPEVMA